ncbi:MAG TPA: hypothetical protein DEF51_57180 [Myxococcales bacterium]|nr:hypothetical protein [Myxococcales bacterium]
MADSSSVARQKAPGLAPGSVVGGRFQIERAVSEDALGSVLAAKDQKTGRPIAVRVLSPGLIATPAAIEKLRGEVKTAATIQHKSIVATYGMGNDKGGARFIATEWVDGRPLEAVIAEKKSESATPMSLRGAYNVVAHVCKALGAAAKKGAFHGALRPGVVFVTRSGRVKVGGLGLDKAIVETAGPAALGAGEQAFLAPEVKQGQPPTAASDVFGIGGLLYAMLTGRSPLDEFIAPSQAHPEASPEVDAVLMKCLSADPAARFGSAQEVKAALVGLAKGTEPTTDQEDFGVDLDLDIDIGSLQPPPSAPQAQARPRPPAPAKAPGGGPQVGQRVALDESFRSAPGMVAPVASAEVDLSHLLTKITENDAPRWMVVKDNLDHGPFSGRELVNLILQGEVLGEHRLLNMDTGQRFEVREAPEFVEFVEQFRLKKAEQDHQVALQKSEKAEKVSMVSKIMILGGVAAVVGVGVVVFLVTRPDIQEEERSDADVADLYERGEIEISGSAGILPDPPRRTGRRRARRGGGAGGMSYEDAMNQVADLGSATGTGSQRRLTPQQVAGVMNQNINRLVPCLSQGSGGGQVRIDMAIAGSGQVQGATVRNGTPAFQRCVAGRVRQIRFPSFPAPRMGASYTFSAN